MAARLAAPPRTPSPKIRIHRSQSFDSPSSRISVTPIDDSPYSKSTGSIICPKALPKIDALKAAEQAIIRRNGAALIGRKMSDDSIMTDSSGSDSGSDMETSPSVSPSSEYGLFSTGSPAASSPDRHFSSTPAAMPPFQVPEILSSNLEIYQDPSTPMYDPWLVRVVLDMFDVRGFDWMVMPEIIERAWGVRTCSAEVLGILSGNGRVGRRWWD